MADPHSPDGPNGIYVLPFADIAHVRKMHLDLAYASGSVMQKLDLYLPENTVPTGGWPLIIFVHGGAWMQCDKRDIQLDSPLTFLEKGFAVASVNYRLSSEALFPAQIFDVKAAIRFLRASADIYRLDPERFALWGTSAGGQLVSLAGTTNALPIMEDLGMGSPDASSTVQAVISFYGPTDLGKMDFFLLQTGAGPADHCEPNSPESLMLGDVPARIPQRVIAANPETWVTRDCPPFFLAHAPKDPTVPFQHSVVFAERINAIAGSGRARLRLVENAGHATPEFDQPALLEEVRMFLMEALHVPVNQATTPETA